MAVESGEVLGFPLDQIIPEILRYGFAGIVIIALVWWILKREKKHTECEEARVEELKKMGDLVERNTSALVASERRGQVIENLAEVVKLSAQAQANNTAATASSVERLERSANAALESNTRMREAVLRLLSSGGKDHSL